MKKERAASERCQKRLFIQPEPTWTALGLQGSVEGISLLLSFVFLLALTACFEEVNDFFLGEEFEVEEGCRNELLDILVVFTALVGISLQEFAYVTHRQFLEVLVELLIAK